MSTIFENPFTYLQIASQFSAREEVLIEAKKAPDDHRISQVGVYFLVPWQHGGLRAISVTTYFGNNSYIFPNLASNIYTVLFDNYILKIYF